MQALRFLATHPLSTRLLFNGHIEPKVEGTSLLKAFLESKNLGNDLGRP